MATGDAPAQTQIVVSANAGLIDGLQAAGRYVVVIVTAVTAILAMLKARDAAGIVSYLQTNGGAVIAAVSGLIALGTAAYGVLKTRKRGAQIATVASDIRVPDEVATTK